MSELLLLPFNSISARPAGRSSASETGADSATDFAALLALESFVAAPPDTTGERGQDDGEAPESAANLVAQPEMQNIRQTASLSQAVITDPGLVSMPGNFADSTSEDAEDRNGFDKAVDNTSTECAHRNLDQFVIACAEGFVANLVKPWLVWREAQTEPRAAKLDAKSTKLFTDPDAELPDTDQKDTELKTELNEQLELAPVHLISQPQVANSPAAPAEAAAEAEEFFCVSVTELNENLTAAPIAELPPPQGLPVTAPAGTHDNLVTQQSFSAQAVEFNPHDEAQPALGPRFPMPAEQQKSQPLAGQTEVGDQTSDLRLASAEFASRIENVRPATSLSLTPDLVVAEETDSLTADTIAETSPAGMVASTEPPLPGTTAHVSAGGEESSPAARIKQPLSAAFFRALLAEPKRLEREAAPAAVSKPAGEGRVVGRTASPLIAANEDFALDAPGALRLATALTASPQMEVAQVASEPLPAELQPVDLPGREQFNATAKRAAAPAPVQDVVESDPHDTFAPAAKIQTALPGQLTARPVDVVLAQRMTNHASLGLSDVLGGPAESAPPLTSVGLLTLAASSEMRIEALPIEVLPVRRNLSASLASIVSAASGLESTEAPRPSEQSWLSTASPRSLSTTQAELAISGMDRPATPTAVWPNSNEPFTNRSPFAGGGEFDFQPTGASANKEAFAHVEAKLYGTPSQPLERSDWLITDAQATSEGSLATNEPQGLSALPGDSQGSSEKPAALTDRLTTQLEDLPVALDGANDKSTARRTVSEERVKLDPNEAATATAPSAALPVPAGRGTPVAQTTGTGATSEQQVAEQLAGPLIAASEHLTPGEPRMLRLKLRPRELGQVEIEIRRDPAGRLSAHLTVEHEQANRVLRDELGQLREALERAGLPVGRLDVSIGQGLGWHAGGHSNQSYQAETQPAGGASEPEYPALDSFNGGAQAAQDRLLNLHA